MPLGAILSLASFRSKRKARKDTRKANQLEQERKSISNVLARRQALAALRRQQSQAAAQTLASVGIDGGSGSFNAVGNIDTQVTADVSRQAQLEELDQQRFRRIQSATTNENRGAAIDSVVDFGFEVASAAITGGTSQVAQFLKETKPSDFRRN